MPEMPGMQWSQGNVAEKKLIKSVRKIKLYLKEEKENKLLF